MKTTSNKALSRSRRKLSIRKKIRGTSERPRLSVFRSAKHIYAQIINDDSGTTLASASTRSSAYPADSATGNRDAATIVGRLIAEQALSRDIKTVVFDRNGYIYHGRVQALADAAREAGLEF